MEERGVKAVAAVVVATAAALASSAAFAAHPGLVTGARISRRGDALELHFALSQRSPFRLSQHGSQLWIDLDRTQVELPPRPLFGREVAPAGAVRAFNVGSDKARLLIEVNQRADYAVGVLPGELLVRLAPAGRMPNLASLKLAAPSPHEGRAATAARPRIEGGNRDGAADDEKDEPESPFERAAVKPPVQLAMARGETEHERSRGGARVVIDPGHGGHDPGTEAAGDVAEKTIALQIARRVAAALQRRGVSTELTRDDDTFLSLAERTQFANRANADLFVSIHLNSSPSPSTSGIEVYYLNNTTDRATIRLARMENAATAERDYGTEADPNLNYILSDLRQEYKASESSMLAQMIQEQTVSELRDEFGEGVRGLGAKKGPFYVLVGAHMPAVLVECGFLSNEDEAHRLNSPEYQARIADGIATAVVDYLNADVTAGTL